jgi:putative xylitol transport system permease protein
MSAESSTSPGKLSRWTTVGALSQQYGIVLAFFVLCGFLSVLNNNFYSIGNLVNILRQTSINGILASGMTLVVLTKGIDLSVGSVAAYAGLVSASFAHGMNPQPAWVAVCAGLAVGIGCGLVNGFLVARLAVPPFVATLGMLSAARGLTFIYSDGQPIPDLSKSFSYLGEGVLFQCPVPWFDGTDVFRLPIPSLIFLFVLTVLWFVLNKTTFGRYIYAVGGNERSAKTAGIGTKKVIVSAYLISGLLAALGGIILTGRTGSGLPQAGQSYELDAIAAVVIGGTSLSGGVGTISGTLFGALIIGVINNGLDLLGVSSYYQQLVKGCIIVGAVLLDTARHSRE